MSYKLGKRKASACATNASPKMLPTHQLMSLTRGIAPSRKSRQRSTRSLRREALRNATERRVAAEKSILARKGLSNKHLSDAQRAKLFKDLATPYKIAYKKHPELFKWDIL